MSFQLSKVDRRWWYALAGIGVVLLMPSPNAQLTAHFNVREFDSHDGVKVPLALLPNLRRLATQLEKIRARVGSPIVVMSGFRTKAHNDDVGGASHSQHLLATAADIRAPSYQGGDEKALYSLILSMIARGELHNGGVGFYPRGGTAGWVHYDVRPNPARWQG